MILAQDDPLFVLDLNCLPHDAVMTRMHRAQFSVLLIDKAVERDHVIARSISLCFNIDRTHHSGINNMAPSTGAGGFRGLNEEELVSRLKQGLFYRV